jgi:tetratricopeptide (TPR) repeat protein
LPAPMSDTSRVPSPPGQSEEFSGRAAPALISPDREGFARVRLSGLVRVLQEQKLPVTVGTLVVVGLIVAVSYSILHRPTKDDLAILSHAKQLESQGNWPAALTEYETLAGSSGALAGQSRDQATRLGKLLEQEDSLFREARADEASGHFSEANQLYQEVADLHGDKESEALGAVGRLNAEHGPTPSDQSPRPSTIVPPKPSHESRSSRIQTKPEAQHPKCQLIQSDIAKHLDRADRDRARGEYVDAIREYNAVLDCDPGDQRARTGLATAKDAEALQKVPPPN